MEIWDAYGKDFKRISGAKLMRGQAIPDGLYHLAGDIIVRHTDRDYKGREYE